MSALYFLPYPPCFFHHAINFIFFYSFGGALSGFYCHFGSAKIIHFRSRPVISRSGAGGGVESNVGLIRSFVKLHLAFSGVRASIRHSASDNGLCAHDW